MPAFNAADHLQETIARIQKKSWTSLCKLYIINDGSSDSTLAIAQELSKKNDSITVIDFKTNRGYGAVVKEGFKRCKNDGCDYAVCLHSDGQYPPESLPEFIDTMEAGTIDLLQGSRIASGGALKGGMPVYKYIANRCLTFFENIVFGLRLTDFHSGFLCYSRLFLDTIDLDRLSNSFDIDVELIASARRKKLTIAELPIPTRYAGEISHVRSVPYGLCIVRIMIRYLLGRY